MDSYNLCKNLGSLRQCYLFCALHMDVYSLLLWLALPEWTWCRNVVQSWAKRVVLESRVDWEDWALHMALFEFHQRAGIQIGSLADPFPLNGFLWKNVCYKFQKLNIFYDNLNMTSRVDFRLRVLNPNFKNSKLLGYMCHICHLMT